MKNLETIKQFLLFLGIENQMIIPETINISGGFITENGMLTRLERMKTIIEFEVDLMNVSGHSGLPESVELRQLEEKYNRQKEKRDQQMAVVCGVLDKMPNNEQRWFLTELIKKYIYGGKV